MASDPLIPTTDWKLERVLFGPEEIRATNLQRFEMEQLDAITVFDKETHGIVGYRDVREDAFWVRGHIPGRPLMPGVMMLEAMAQLTSFYCGRYYEDDDRFIGFGGLDNVKFRRAVLPGERLVMVARGVKIRPRRAIFDAQGFVNGSLCVEAQITGLRL